jgi:hypothetical protein
MHCFYHLHSRSDYILHIFLSGYMTIITTTIYVILNHFEIVFQFNSTSVHRLILAYRNYLVEGPRLYKLSNVFVLTRLLLE